MTKLKPGPISDDKPVKVTAVHRDLLNYAELLGRSRGHNASTQQS